MSMEPIRALFTNAVLYESVPPCSDVAIMRSVARPMFRRHKLTAACDDPVLKVQSRAVTMARSMTGLVGGFEAGVCVMAGGAECCRLVC